jgi:hypothetical protein
VLSALLKEAPLGELRKADAARVLKGRYVNAKDWEGWWRRAVERAKTQGLLAPHPVRNVFISPGDNNQKVDVIAAFSATESAFERRELLRRYVSREWKEQRGADDDEWKFLLNEYVKVLERGNVLEGLYGLAVLHSNASISAKKGIESVIRERVLPWAELRTFRPPRDAGVIVNFLIQSRREEAPSQALRWFEDTNDLVEVEALFEALDQESTRHLPPPEEGLHGRAIVDR